MEAKEGLTAEGEHVFAKATTYKPTEWDYKAALCKNSLGYTNPSEWTGLI
jgi:hypothetical protein